VIRHGGTCPIVDDIPGLRPVSLKGPWTMYNPMGKLMVSVNMDIRPLPQQELLADYHFNNPQPHGTEDRPRPIQQRNPRAAQR